MRYGLVVAVLLLMLVLPAGGTSASASRLYRNQGVTLRYPERWFATTRSLTHVTDPRQIVAIASYPLPSSNRGDDGCQPKEALDHLPADGAFIYGWEYRPDSGFGPPRRVDFSPKPAHFKLSGYRDYECLGRSFVLAFRESGRYFQVHVALGHQASATTRRAVLSVLDSFAAKRR